MKKVFLTTIAVALLSSSAFAREACVDANMKGSVVTFLMAILNKNGLNYKVIKKSDEEYNVIVKAKSSFNSVNINSKLLSLTSLPILKEADINFARSVEGRCVGFDELEDITKL